MRTSALSPRNGTDHNAEIIREDVMAGLVGLPRSELTGEDLPGLAVRRHAPMMLTRASYRR